LIQIKGDQQLSPKQGVRASTPPASQPREGLLTSYWDSDAGLRMARYWWTALSSLDHSRSAQLPPPWQALAGTGRGWMWFEDLLKPAAMWYNLILWMVEHPGINLKDRCADISA